MGAAEGKPLSAASARKIVKRAPKVRLISKPMEFTVKDAKGKEYKGTFKIIAALCPGIKTTTLKRRLDSGHRSLESLRKAPEAKQGARSRRARR